MNEKLLQQYMIYFNNYDTVTYSTDLPELLYKDLKISVYKEYEDTKVFEYSYKGKTCIYNYDRMGEDLLYVLPYFWDDELENNIIKILFKQL